LDAATARRTGETGGPAQVKALLRRAGTEYMPDLFNALNGAQGLKPSRMQ
jgi:hypothetical protein